jgi:hypothetical protein
MTMSDAISFNAGLLAAKRSQRISTAERFLGSYVGQGTTPEGDTFQLSDGLGSGKDT